MRIIMIAVAILLGVTAIGFGGVYWLSERALFDVDYDQPFTTPIPTDQASIEHGRYIARTRGCFGCHGQNLEGKDFGEQWDWPKRAVAPNLAAYARNSDPAVIEAAVRQGISRSGKAMMAMPSFNFARLTDADMAALIAFLKSAPVVDKELPKAEFGWIVRADIILGAEMHTEDWADLTPPLRIDSAKSPRLARGEYLAMTMCNECHGLDLRGHTIWPPPVPDLAIVAAYPREDFNKLLNTGLGLGERNLGLMTLVAPDRFYALSDEEIDDLYLFLSSLQNEPVPENVIWRPLSE